ncbi:protein US31 [Cercopithecine betaherpesvirus 5]|uniref:Protein US31 n=1 Tax=Simian cytomegalovirus (strain Colburn) TaxID=50292 RepID=G8XTN9_SCMVC|nr:protein US31 [Cercopithecine betaherpesvirus 5]AEV80531.1 protein US31 [Cercopithecine betaherpesvirus 5]
MEDEEAWRGLLLSSHSVWCVCGHWKAHIVVSDEANSERVDADDWMEYATMRWLRQAREAHDEWCECTDWRAHAMCLDENRITLVGLPPVATVVKRTAPAPSACTSRFSSCLRRMFKSLRKRRTNRSSVTSSGGASTVSSHSWRWYGMLPYRQTFHH